MCHELAVRALERCDGDEDDSLADDNHHTSSPEGKEEERSRPRRRRTRASRCNSVTVIAVLLAILGLLVFLSVDQSIRDKAIEIALDKFNASFDSVCRMRREEANAEATTTTSDK